MQCPVCPESTLLMSHREGVEIDYCPQCRGVWLDRGELDKLIALGASHEARSEVSRSRPAEAPRRDFDDSDFGRRAHGGGHRKKSWLNDLFD